VTGFRKRRWYTHENLGEEPLDLPPTDLMTTGYWVSLSDETVTRLREAGAWTNDPNNYGPDWPKIRDRVRARDKYTCQVCGAVEASRQHDVHHKVPFRAFTSLAEANRLENLTTLCPSCHHKVEQNVRMRSGLSGLAYVLRKPGALIPDVRCRVTWGRMLNLWRTKLRSARHRDLYACPGGIGFSEKLFEMHDELIARAPRAGQLNAPAQTAVPPAWDPAARTAMGLHQTGKLPGDLEGTAWRPGSGAEGSCGGWRAGPPALFRNPPGRRGRDRCSLRSFLSGEG
jgi:5-methylcytosine-specific restriction endonuclease McrA